MGMWTLWVIGPGWVCQNLHSAVAARRRSWSGESRSHSAPGGARCEVESLCRCGAISQIRFGTSRMPPDASPLSSIITVVTLAVGTDKSPG